MQVEEGWWEGILNGKTGMFPSNFIKELSDSDDVGIAQEELVKPSKEKKNLIDVLYFCRCLYLQHIDRVVHSYLLLGSGFECHALNLCCERVK